MSSLYKVTSYIKHKLRSLLSSYGYGIHSPFAFYLVSEIINPRLKSYYYCFSRIERLRHQWLKDKTSIHLKNGETSSLKRVCLNSSTPAKDGQLLFKLGTLLKSNNIIETGTSLGLGTSYLASISSKANVISIDHDSTIQDCARKSLEHLNINNVDLICDSIDNGLQIALNRLESVDFIFLDAYHKGDATIKYFNMLLPYTHQNTIIVCHDIHWSKDMNDAWVEIVKSPKKSLSIELYNMGLVFFNSDFQRLHYYA